MTFTALVRLVGVSDVAGSFAPRRLAHEVAELPHLAGVEIH